MTETLHYYAFDHDALCLLAEVYLLVNGREEVIGVYRCTDDLRHDGEAWPVYRFTSPDLLQHGDINTRLIAAAIGATAMTDSVFLDIVRDARDALEDRRREELPDTIADMRRDQERGA